MTPDVLANALRLLEYHQHAMESRRSIELKLFTGAVAFLLVSTHGLLELLQSPSSEANTDESDVASLFVQMNGLWWLAALFVMLLVTYLALLICVEAASKKNRESYWNLESHARSAVQASCAGQEWAPVHDLSAPRKESLPLAILRSWAATPPFVATCLIATACWVAVSMTVAAL